MGTRMKINARADTVKGETASVTISVCILSRFSKSLVSVTISIYASVSIGFSELNAATSSFLTQ